LIHSNHHYILNIEEMNSTFLKIKLKDQDFFQLQKLLHMQSFKKNDRIKLMLLKD